MISKRILDLIISVAGLAFLLPAFILLSALIKLDNKGPVFFRQQRVGRDGRHFAIYKFRTMVVDAENQGSGMVVKEKDPRITRIGRLLREYSLDELPQLINIFKGEMSLVGPRPTLAYQVEKYNQRQMLRLSVQPGLTGWAQVNGRSSLSWPERIELDLWYIESWSLWLDLKVLLKTFTVFLDRGKVYRRVEYDSISDQNPEKVE